VAKVCVTEKVECSPLTKTDGDHQITKEKVERNKSRNTCEELRKDRGRGKDDVGPVKTETDETRSTLLAKITGVCEISL